MEDDVIASLQRRLAGLENEQASVASALGAALKRGQRPRDEPYQCPACHTIMAWYHRPTDTLRVTHMGLVLRLNLGPGGLVRFTCHTCGEVQDLDTSTPFTGELLVRPGGGAVLDVDALRALLAQAESNGGTVTLQVKGSTPQDG